MSRGTPAREQIRNLPIDLITPGSTQARRHFDQAALDDLAASIRESGVIQPVVVRTRIGGYELLAGERRWRASQIAGLHEIPSIIRDDLTEGEALVLGLIENLQRESLPPVDAAGGMQRLGETLELSHADIGLRIGKSREYVTNFLRLLSLTRVVADLVNEGVLSVAHGKLIAGVPEHEQVPLAHEVIRDRISVRALERRLAAKKKPTRVARGKSNDLKRLEQDLSDLMGYPVVIVDDGDGRGHLKVSYNTLDELEGVMERMGYRSS